MQKISFYSMLNSANGGENRLPAEKRKMQIILLSGGSGKRLWPLSNETRSKQFLCLLKSPDSHPESMVQRIVRQLSGCIPEAKLTAATSLSQRDAIVNQVGNRIDVVTEPERRDTFAAIVLASAYLAGEKGCCTDEVIVVMPCDPYTEKGYYETISLMAKAVEEQRADLVLMGVKPENASGELGYILAEDDGSSKAGDVLKVKQFVEKPSPAKAEEMITRGAFWNGGVFAFRLGWLLEFAKRYVNVESYEKVREEYSKLPKVSFDFEVLEKAVSVGMIPFEGKWSDLGDWGVLTKHLTSRAIGNTVMAGNDFDTYAINELGIPMLCVGAKNLVVAASPDGILIADKNSCELVKDYVDQMKNRPMYEERRWGAYKVIDRITFPDGHCALTKQLYLKPGGNISYQLHRHREEVWTFVNGEGLLALDGKVRRVSRGDVIHIAKGELHAVKALSDLHIIEVQSGDNLIEEDIERFPWSWEE